MKAWTLHHIVALCSDCGWTFGPTDLNPQGVMTAARRHAQVNEHYVQVERGQHAHYDHRRPPADRNTT